MWPFKEREVAKQWSDFKKMDFCNACRHLEEDRKFGDCCPKCGSEDFKKVIARWEFHYVGGGLCHCRINGRYELRGGSVI